MKSDMILELIGEAKGTYVWEAQQIRTRRKAKTVSINRIWLIAAVILLLLAFGAGTAWAISGNGFFRDIFIWNRTITGTSYENATDEIIINASASDSTLTITISFANPLAEPYALMETMKVKHFDILDETGKTILNAKESEVVQITSGAAEISIADLGLPHGHYSIVITELTAGKKAEQPLGIHGTWGCGFVLQ